MEAWEEVTEAEEWEGVEALFLSVPVIGSVDLKDVVTTTLLRMSAVCDVAQAVLVPPLLPTPVILLQWTLPTTIA
jgi:hypothetical protein